MDFHAAHLLMLGFMAAGLFLAVPYHGPYSAVVGWSMALSAAVVLFTGATP